MKIYYGFSPAEPNGGGEPALWVGSGYMEVVGCFFEANEARWPVAAGSGCGRLWLWLVVIGCGCGR